MGFFTIRSVVSLAAMAALLVPAQAQTYSTCNPLKKTCPPDEALGTTTDVDLTSKPSDFITSGVVSYGDGGAELAVSESNKGPYMQSNWYMMFGRVDVTMKAAPGAGVVSSFILQSDDLDEIDLEWVGDQTTELQTNFFGKGFTGTYNRGETYHTVDAAADYHTYTIDWTTERIQWIVDGDVVRTLTPSDFPGQYPQSPMFIKFGPWAAGDPTNNPKGVVHWSDGPIDWSAGPYPMYVQSITAQDYSTGTQYKYTDQSGSWQSIEAIGGTVNGGSQGSGGGSHSSSPSSTPAPSHSPKPSSTPTSGHSEPSSKSSKSDPAPTLISKTSEIPTPPTHSPVHVPPHHYTSSVSDGGSSTTTGGGSSPTHSGVAGPTGGHTGHHSSGPNPTHSPVPTNGADSGKQAALGLSLVGALVGVVAAI